MHLFLMICKRTALLFCSQMSLKHCLALFRIKSTNSPINLVQRNLVLCCIFSRGFITVKCSNCLSLQKNTQYISSKTESSQQSQIWFYSDEKRWLQTKLSGSGCNNYFPLVRILFPFQEFCCYRFFFSEEKYAVGNTDKMTVLTCDCTMSFLFFEKEKLCIVY